MASELTLRIMKRIVDKNLGPDAQPRQSVQSRPVSSEMNISRDEENTLKQLINSAKSGTVSAQSSKPRATAKSKSIQEFAASYNKGKSAGSRPAPQPSAMKSQKMNLNDFVQTVKK